MQGVVLKSKFGKKLGSRKARMPESFPDLQSPSLLAKKWEFLYAQLRYEGI
jgi:hypothetical protein